MAHLSATLPDKQVHLLRLLRQLRLAMWIFAICVLLSVVAAAFSAREFVHAAARLAEAKSGGTFGVEPIHSLAHVVARAIAFAIFFIHVVGEITFLVAMTKIRRVAETQLGQPAFRRSWRWTIGSCFIPILNVVRPWIGFSELYLLVKRATPLRHATTQIRQLRSSVATFALWISFMLLCLDRFLVHVVSYGLNKAITLHGDILGQYWTLGFSFKLDAGIIAWTGCHVFLYVARLRRYLIRLASDPAAADHSSGVVSTNF
jgi:hypothetical protein